MKRAIILLSGGIDSTTTLAIAHSQGFKIYAMSFDYGQRHIIELGSARMIAESFNIQKHLIINFNLRDIGGSALTSEVEVPKKSAQAGKLVSENDVSAIPVTYVPARNTIFLSFALGWAEVLGAEDIFIGANAVDYSGYPDCRPEFIKAFEDLANLATKASVEGTCKFNVHAPLLYLTKEDIIKKGIELGVDYSMTWSCYDPQGSREKERKRGTAVPCLRCDSCMLREKGFEKAGMRDPLISDL